MLSGRTGVLVSGTLIGDYSPDQLRNRFTGLIAKYQPFVVYGTKVYRLEYNTTDTDGKPVKASGALLVPTVATPLPMLSIQHGTITVEADAPSYFKPSSDAYSFGSAFASQGYIVAAPDYIGYGASKALEHPYENRNGLATESLDMLRAAREFISSQRINWDKRLFIAGYSEGGYATLALHKKIEEETGSEFNLVASSCGAGAYDKPAFMNIILNQTTMADPGANRLYIWTLLTYDRIYKLNRPMSFYFKEPYATQIAALGREVVIKASLSSIMTDSFKKGVNDGTDKAFVAAIKDNDIHDWKPRTPTQLYHGDIDEVVPYINSKNTYDAMKKRGASNVELKTLKGAGHAGAASGFTSGTYDFFGAIQ
ncbi:alpha/beta fold hydrolase [Spirosoma areae]